MSEKLFEGVTAAGVRGRFVREAALHQHRLILMGGVHPGLRVAASVLHEAVGALLEGARLAARFTLEGESVQKGPRPAWLDAACAVQITGLSAGSAVIQLEAPTLREVAATHGREGAPVWADMDPGWTERTAIDLFGRVLASLIEGDADDVLADRGLLDTCVRFARLPSGEFTGVRLDGLVGRPTPLTLTAAHARQIELLRDETPPPQAVRVAGKLDTISASRSDLILRLKDGGKIPVRLEDHDPEALRTLFGKSVVVSGVAQYRPSGRLLFLKGEAMFEAGPGDQLFEVAPVARQRLPLVPPGAQDRAAGVAAFFGTWPGDESDEELLAAVQALR